MGEYNYIVCEWMNDFRHMNKFVNGWIITFFRCRNVWKDELMFYKWVNVNKWMCEWMFD